MLRIISATYRLNQVFNLLKIMKAQATQKVQQKMLSAFALKQFNQWKEE